MKRALFFLVVVACARTQDATALPQGKSTPPAPPRPLPKLDTSCNADVDCAVISDEVQDDAPRTYACCPGCTQRAANASWYERFQAACAAAPAPMCPPIGCAAPVVHAVCRAHKCEIATSK